MNKSLQKLLEQLVPFIFLGVAIAFGIAILIMFFYLFIWGVVIGGIIWLVYFIKNYFFPKIHAKSKGRVIEHEDKD